MIRPCFYGYGVRIPEGIQRAEHFRQKNSPAEQENLGKTGHQLTTQQTGDRIVKIIPFLPGDVHPGGGRGRDDGLPARGAGNARHPV